MLGRYLPFGLMCFVTVRLSSSSMVHLASNYVMLHLIGIFFFFSIKRKINFANIMMMVVMRSSTLGVTDIITLWPTLDARLQLNESTGAV